MIRGKVLNLFGIEFKNKYLMGELVNINFFLDYSIKEIWDNKPKIILQL